MMPRGRLHRASRDSHRQRQGYVSREFREVLAEHELAHQRIKPHCPEENGLMERAYRTLREALDGQELPIDSRQNRYSSK